MKILILLLLSLNVFAGFTEFPPISGSVGGGGGGGSSIGAEYSETEVEDGTWKGVTAYRRCFTVAITTTGTDVLQATFDSGLTMIESYNYSGALQMVRNYAVASGWGAIIYDPADGQVSIYTFSYQFGAGDAYCLRYTK